MGLLLACVGLMAAPPQAEAIAPPEILRSYQEARSRAGRSSEEQVRLALWCEAHGLTRERLNHLALAALSDPGNATARGLMGLVSHEGRFLRPEAVAERSQADPALAEYDARRSKAPYTADGQWEMGLWADRRGLKDQARAHFTAVTRLDPGREVAWKRLGYRKHKGRWVTDDQLAAERAEAASRKQAEKVWKPRIDKYRSMLDQPSRRDEAEAALLAISDPLAVPSIIDGFLAGPRPDPLRAARVLGQIDSPRASRALASQAILAKAPEVRRAALETLRRRDPRDFVGIWIGLIRDTVKYQVAQEGRPGSPGVLAVEGRKANLRRVYGSPTTPDLAIPPGARVDYDAEGLPVVSATVGVTPAARVEWVPYYDYDNTAIGEALSQVARSGKVGDLANTVAHPPASGPPALRIAGYLPYLVNDAGVTPISFEEANRINFAQAEAKRVTLEEAMGTARNASLWQEKQLRIPIGAMRRDAQKASAAAREKLAADVGAIDRVNAVVRRSNEPVLQALRTVTGKDFGDDSAAWNRWWTDQAGYAFAITQATEKPTIVESVPLAQTPTALPQIVDGAIFGVPIPPGTHSCFAAGTMVRTNGGERAIETIRAGDLVLTQDTKRGALTYQPVVAANHNPPSPTLRVRLGGETVVATGIHRFWRPGQGWAMARDLEAGDIIRTLGGVARVESVEEDRVQPVFNLEVAGGTASWSASSGRWSTTTAWSSRNSPPSMPRCQSSPRGHPGKGNQPPRFRASAPGGSMTARTRHTP